jgi:hypothetical protein
MMRHPTVIRQQAAVLLKAAKKGMIEKRVVVRQQPVPGGRVDFLQPIVESR